MNDQCPGFSHLLIFPRRRVQNANAISSPLTHGFPSMTAFIGLMWALQRKARLAGVEDIRFRAIGVICHRHQELVTGRYDKAFRLTRNPIGKDGKIAAIVEEGRIHLDISLVLAVEAPMIGRDRDSDQALAARLGDSLETMRIAGGTQLSAGPRSQPYWAAMTGDAEGRNAVFRSTILRLLPGFALVSRDDLLSETLEAQRKHNPDATVLDAWLTCSRWNHRYDSSERKWVQDRSKGSGWIVPIPVGYTALTDLQPAGSVVNARDADTPFRFVESLYSLGQWIGPHRIEYPGQLLWYPDTQADTGVYRCRNDFINPQMPADELDWLEDA
ncbi:type I-F CRISPR-associated protein Csy2 [Lysobacter pythonis]|uniref:Type I-F CRISPR-associated protein Csy2 n=1 Tax=Solilutibacter pythonis TaxID=2483112 RepID=A0A3M2HL84_9GAMM|nr:type I-F CRISPR-associated protein Csy2 [Lysobacter pythonis]RMH89105.1 type I-F CRISPR-associated protein Csy2 [Lysobacter pythonis]